MCLASRFETIEYYQIKCKFRMTSRYFAIKMIKKNEIVKLIINKEQHHSSGEHMLFLILSKRNSVLFMFLHVFFFRSAQAINHKDNDVYYV